MCTACKSNVFLHVIVVITSTIHKCHIVVRWMCKFYTFQILGNTVSSDGQHPDVDLVESVPRMLSDDDSMHRPSVSKPQNDSLTAPCLGKYVSYSS